MSHASQEAPEALVVVGDRFEEFLANRGTIGYSALLTRLRTGDLPESLAISVGQGLSAAQLDELRELVELRTPAVTFGKQGLPAHAEQRLTHKHKQRNVLVGPVGQIGERRFVADLVLDERVEVLEDHLTGQHIPAITLLEAARQLWTVVTEQFFLTGTDRTRFVIGSVDSSFHSFVFPMSATLSYELLAHTRTPVGTVFRCRVGFHHGEATAPAAEVEAEYRVIPEKISAKQEALAARQAVASEVTRLREQTAPAESVAV
ncbi:AfsA-related hotdog domain-containing protein [Streptomyces caniferus]|uniref:AfsA-related hotdog domain-containing protein n=1 Tax=Streptomyces caniferus TaxID=285557 RepID=UPI0033E382D6